MNYNRELLIERLGDAQGFDAKVKFAKTNPNFTRSSGDRIMFYNDRFHSKKVAADATWTKEKTVELLKGKWHDKHFPDDWVDKAAFAEGSVLDGSLVLFKDPLKSLEYYRNISYMYVEVDGVAKYYFVDTMSFLPGDIVQYGLTLDSVTTYLDTLQFGGYAKVERRHYDRFNHDTTYPEERLKSGVFMTKYDFAMNINVAGTWTHEFDLTELGTKTIADMHTVIPWNSSPEFLKTRYGNIISHVSLAIRFGKFDNLLTYKEFKFSVPSGTDKDGPWTTTTYRFEISGRKIILKVTINGTNTGALTGDVVLPGIWQAYENSITTNDVVPNYDEISGVWNVDNTMSVGSLILTETRRSHRVHKFPRTDTYYQTYFDQFNVGSDDKPKFLYQLKKIDANTWKGIDPTSNYIEDGGSIVSLLVPLHSNKAGVTWSGEAFGANHYIGNYNVMTATNTNGIIALDIPVTTDPGRFVKLNDGQWYVSQGRAFHDGETSLSIANPLVTPLVNSLDTKTIKIDAKREWELEPKLRAEEYMKLQLYSATDESKELFNYRIDPGEYWLNIDRGIIATETKTQNVFNLNKVYNDTVKDSQAIFISAHFEQVPSLSEPYKEYMLQHQSAYQTGIAQNRFNMGWNAVTSIFHPIQMATGIKNSLQKEKQMFAQVADLKRQGAAPIGSNTSLFSDNITENYLKIYNDLSLNIYTPPEAQRRMISDYFNKYGYIDGKLEPFNEYADLSRRHRFSHWDTANFRKAINSSNLSVEILDDINDIFDTGVTLWNVLDDTGKVEINDYTLENWENWIAKLVK